MRIARPDDFHVHVRQGEALPFYVRDLAQIFGRALVMPNTVPPVVTPDGLVAYRDEIRAAAANFPWFKPLMTFKILPNMLPADIVPLAKAGAVAGKLYPQGATTNSQDGVAEVEAIFPVLAAMEAANLILCIHGEDPKAFSLDREAAFLPKVRAILQAFPKLRVVLEHVTSAAGIQLVLDGPDRLAATITVQHLLFDLDALIGDHLRPHLFCKPVLKLPRDRAAIQAAVLSAHPRIFFGSDSAPHNKVAKECDCGAAGCYSAPVSLPLLADFFAREASLEALENFTSRFGARFYGLPVAEVTDPHGAIELVEETWRVPTEYHGVVPLAAGQELGWRVRSVEVR